MAETHPLLELQRIDSIGDELRARRAGLPERTALKECTAEMADLARRKGETLERRDALAVEERRVDGIVSDLQTKSKEVETSLYSGKVSAPKELEALQQELGSFQRRQGEQEEAELALMEEEERLNGEIAVMEGRHAELETRSAALRASIDAAEQEIDGELDGVADERAQVMTGVSPALLAPYEKLRARSRPGGRAAVQLKGGACGGCRVTVPISDARRVRDTSQDSAVLCAGCGSILVA